MSARRTRARRLAEVALALALGAGPVSAHLVQSGLGSFYDGVLHLALTPADLLVVLGLALLAGLQGKAGARALLLALPAAWLTGGIAGASMPETGDLPRACAGSVALVGALVAWNARLPRAPLVALGCAVGMLHGWANGATLAPGGADPLGLAGAGLTVFTLVALVAALVVPLRAPAGRIAVRVAGSWIAAIGVLTLAWLARPR